MNVRLLRLFSLALVLATGRPVLAVVDLPSSTLGTTFYSMQKPEQPPLPVNRWPALPLYPMGSNGLAFLVDDRQIDLEAVAFQNELAALLSGEFAAGPLDGGAIGGDEALAACGVRLGISASNQVVTLTLTNARPNRCYELQYLTDLNLPNWTSLGSVVGGPNYLAQTNVPASGFTNLFFRAAEATEFWFTNGLGQYDPDAMGVADCMGAVGPEHFVELLNGVVAVYSKQGILVAHTNASAFFSPGTNYPAFTALADPRIAYDHRDQRWVAAMWGRTSPSNYLAVLVVSAGSAPTNLADGWRRYFVDVQRPGHRTDFTTLGFDGNGIYLTLVQFQDTESETINGGQTVVAIKKPEIYQGQYLATRLDTTNGLPVWTIQPAVNFDAVSSNGYSWFVAKGPPDWSPNYRGGAVVYRRLQWTGNTAVWVDTDWQQVPDPSPTYCDYFDLDGTNVTVVPNPSTGISAPQFSGTNAPAPGIDLHLTGSRLQMAVIRHDKLWTCHRVGVSDGAGSYTGDQTGTNVSRSGVQWLRFTINATGQALTYDLHGRIYDSAATNAWWYYFPSLAVNDAGDMAMGFGGSSPTNYISCFWSWRLEHCQTMMGPRLIRSGTGLYDNARWGDYSATSLDPSDPWRFWTVQQVSEPIEGIPNWQTVLSMLEPAP